MTADPVTDHGLILHTSNRLESLAGRLAALMRSVPASPLEPEVIIVQSQGMARWLQLELAGRLGLCANVRFPFPRAFAHEVFRAFDPTGSAGDRTDPAPLTWQIWSQLPWLGDQTVGGPIRRYLTHDPDGRKRHQLARRIARLFDDYAIFRPDLVLAWDSAQGGPADSGAPSSDQAAWGDQHPWQALLWRKLGETAGPDHAARLRARFLQQLESSVRRPPGLPRRVSLFGISSLPPFYVDLFERLARWCSAHCFLLQPAAAYWGDIPSAKTALRRAGTAPSTPSDLHQHEGNALLASLGGQGRDFLNVLLGQTNFNNLDAFEDPGDGSLLHSIQSDILHLRNPGASGGRTTLRPDDDSLSVHSCHSPLRELEVLRDHILHWLSTDPALTPRDILVMTPDIEGYAPLIDAVFASGVGSAGVHPEGRATAEPTPETEPVIPFSVADRGSGSQSPILSTFVRILNLADSRLGVASVAELLETSAVRRRFGLGEAEAFQAREWLRAAGVRWGRDEAHRAALNLPALRQNTWADGLDRLLLGYAMSAGGDQLFQGILPCDGAEGQASDTLGHLLEFIHQLFATLQVLVQKHGLTEWVTILRKLAGDFFAESERDEPDRRLLREVLADLEPPADAAPIDEAIPLAVILEHLGPILADDRIRGGFLTGRVTFGALKPMRSIPFKVICLLGLNDSAFPRANPHLGFDLMAAQPRLGDQSKREDDRYLFLETLLSARERLYLSYVGQSIRDNSPAPPSVLVSELLDYINQGYVLAPPERGLQAASTPEGQSVLEQSVAPEPPGLRRPEGPAPTAPAAMSASSALHPLPTRDGRSRGSRRNRVPANQLSLDFEFPAPAPLEPALTPPPAPTATALVTASPDDPGVTTTPTGADSRAHDLTVPSRQLVYRHRLQAFSADYFGSNPRLFSYSAENFRAGLALRHPVPPAPFVPRALAEPGDEWKTVDLDLLAEFFANPARFLLTRRLDIRLPRPEAELSEREPMELAGLDLFELKTELLEKRLAGQDLATLRPVFLASGRLPLGRQGELRYRELCDSIEEFRERLNRYQPNERVDAPDLDLLLGEFRVIGRFPHVTSKALLNYRPVPISPKDRMRAWVRHLAWCATATAGDPRLSVLVGEPAKARTAAVLQYRPLEARAARDYLAKLLALYWRGLGEPLRFFPKTSLKFAEIDHNNAGRGPDTWKDSLRKARVEWESDRFKDGEQDDDYFKICFVQFDPLDGDFMALARQIGGPLLEHEDRA